MALIVGPKGVKSEVHVGLLMSDSAIFKAAFDTKSGFKEGVEGTMSLLEDDVLTVACYIEYLYKGPHAGTGTIFKNAFSAGHSDNDAALASYK